MIYASEVTRRTQKSLGEELESTLRRLQDDYGYKVLNIFESSKDICGSTYKSFIVIYDTSTSEERPQGEWVGNKFDEHYCNKCGNFALWLEEADGQYYEVESNFCPECGADMRKGRMTNKDKGSLEELIQFCGEKKQRSDEE